jgi:hypothetical protein
MPYGIWADVSGVYVAGRTYVTLPGQTSSGGTSDAFVRKYDHDGTEFWTRQFGTGGTTSTRSNQISGDGSTVYVAGPTSGTLPGQTSSGGSDAFVRRYEHDGTELWTRQFGSATTDWTTGIAVDGSGVYVAGVTDGTLPGQTSSGGWDAFVRKYDYNGTELWTRQFGPASVYYSWGISVDASGVYVAGVTDSTLPGQTSSGGTDAFVRKYDVNGNELWTRQFGTAGYDIPWGLSVDAWGVYVAGATDGTLPGQTSSGGEDAFVRKYDRLTGNELWTYQFGTSGADWCYGLSVDASGVYVAGSTLGSIPGQTNAGGADAFIAKLAK